MARVAGDWAILYQPETLSLIPPALLPISELQAHLLIWFYPRSSVFIRGQYVLPVPTRSNKKHLDKIISRG
jgi:hypothetical protein